MIPAVQPYSNTWNRLLIPTTMTAELSILFFVVYLLTSHPIYLASGIILSVTACMTLGVYSWKRWISNAEPSLASESSNETTALMENRLNRTEQGIRTEQRNVQALRYSQDQSFQKINALDQQINLLKQLNRDVSTLNQQCHSLNQKIYLLKRENTQMKKRMAEKDQQINSLKQENAQMEEREQRLAQLEQRMGTNTTQKTQPVPVSPILGQRSSSPLTFFPPPSPACNPASHHPEARPVENPSYPTEYRST